MSMNDICVETGENANGSSGNDKIGAKDGFLGGQTKLQERGGNASAECIVRHSYGLFSRPSEHRSKTREGSKDQKCHSKKRAFFGGRASIPTIA